jgi:hypothetical protein
MRFQNSIYPSNWRRAQTGDLAVEYVTKGGLMGIFDGRCTGRGGRHEMRREEGFAKPLADVPRFYQSPRPSFRVLVNGSQPTHAGASHQF